MVTVCPDYQKVPMERILHVKHPIFQRCKLIPSANDAALNRSGSGKHAVCVQKQDSKTPRNSEQKLISKMDLGGEHLVEDKSVLLDSFQSFWCL